MNRPVLKEIPERQQAETHAPLRRSVSQQMRDRFESRKTWRHFVAGVYVVTMCAYFAWRYTIINPHSLGLSIAFFAAEAIGFLMGIVTIITSWHYNHRTPLPAPAGLTVDVLVPTYKEPLGIIRRTAMAAKAIEYPHGTFILDDGKRDEVKALAEELGIRYLRRPDNAHAKAGNLNYGLSFSKADFVMTLDADHIALPHALNIMLGFFEDENVAMVQTPQDYYNVDAFQYMSSGSSGRLWHDQSVFYNLAQPCADGVNAASCVGTGVVYRRSALDKIGGIPVDTVTEDIHTSLKLHKNGFRTVYLNEPVAYGVAASDLGEYYKTRHRWGHGNLQALRIEKILTCKGLSPMQRFHYLSLGLIYLEGWQQLLLFGIPVVALITGLQPFTITIFNVLVVLAFPILSYILLQEIGCGFARFWANEMFAMARWPVYMLSAAGLFGKKMPFRSSSKNTQGKVNWRLMAPQITVMTVNALALCIGFLHLTQAGFHEGPLLNVMKGFATTFSRPSEIKFDAVMTEGYTVDLFLIAGAWALYSIVRGGFFIRKVIRDARNSHDFFRFRIPVPAVLDKSKQIYGCITSLSEDWVQLTDFRSVSDIRKGGIFEFTAVMPSGPISLKVNIQDMEHVPQGISFAGQLVWPSSADRDRFANGLYSVDWHREFVHRNGYFKVPSDILRACFGRKPEGAIRMQKGVAAILYSAPHPSFASQYGVMFNNDAKARESSFVTFHELAPGSEIIGVKVSPEAESASQKYRVLTEEPLSSLVEKGLDGATPRRYRIAAVA